MQKDRDVVTLDDVLLLETHGETAQAAATRLHRPVVVMDRSESDVAVIAAATSNRLEETEKARFNAASPHRGDGNGGRRATPDGP